MGCGSSRGRSKPAAEAAEPASAPAADAAEGAARDTGDAAPRRTADAPVVNATTKQPSEEEKTAAPERRRGGISRASAFVSPDLLRNLKQLQASPPQESDFAPISSTFWGAVMFVDVAGYTALSEMLARRGPVGMEALNTAVSAYFAEIVAVLQSFGGWIERFAGDAMICCFASPPDTASSTTADRPSAPGSAEGGDDRVEPSVAARVSILCGAVACAVQLRHKLGTFQVPATNVTLSVHIGISAGFLAAVVAGSAPLRRLLFGKPLAVMGAVMQPCKTLEISVHGDIVEFAGSHAEALVEGFSRSWFSEPVSVSSTAGASMIWKVAPTADTGILDMFNREFRRPDRAAADNPAGELDLPEHQVWVRRFIDGFIAEKVDAGQVAFLFQLRKVTALFVTIEEGYSEIDGSVDLVRIHEILCAVQTQLNKLEGTMLNCLVDEKGFNLVLGFGVPISHSRDDLRAVRCAEFLSRRFDCRIGISTGQVFCGPVGVPNVRTDFSAVGDVINTAARLASYLLVRRSERLQERQQLQSVALDSSALVDIGDRVDSDSETEIDGDAEAASRDLEVACDPSVWHNLQSMFEWRFVNHVPFKGKSLPVAVYILLEPRSSSQSSRSRFAIGASRKGRMSSRSSRTSSGSSSPVTSLSNSSSQEQFFDSEASGDVFVGRRTELDAVSSIFHRELLGDPVAGHIVFIYGGIHMGKTALLWRMNDIARSNGFDVFSFKISPSFDGEELGIYSEILQSLLQTVADTCERWDPLTAAETVKRFVPAEQHPYLCLLNPVFDGAVEFDTTPESVLCDKDVAMLHMLPIIRAFIAGYMEFMATVASAEADGIAVSLDTASKGTKPLCISVDDFHFVDMPSWRVTRYLADHPLENFVMFCSLRRSEDLSRAETQDWSPKSMQWFQGLAFRSTATVLSPSSFSKDDIREYLSIRMGDGKRLAVDETVVDLLHAHTRQGHPYYVSLVTNHLLRAGALQVVLSVVTFNIGKSVEASELERLMTDGENSAATSVLSHLSTAGQLVIRLAAVISVSYEFCVPLLEAVVEAFKAKLISSDDPTATDGVGSIDIRRTVEMLAVVRRLFDPASGTSLPPDAASMAVPGLSETATTAPLFAGYRFVSVSLCDSLYDLLLPSLKMDIHLFSAKLLLRQSGRGGPSVSLAKACSARRSTSGETKNSVLDQSSYHYFAWFKARRLALAAGCGADSSTPVLFDRPEDQAALESAVDLEWNLRLPQLAGTEESSATGVSPRRTLILQRVIQYLESFPPEAESATLSAAARRNLLAEAYLEHSASLRSIASIDALLVSLRRGRDLCGDQSSMLFFYTLLRIFIICILRSRYVEAFAAMTALTEVVAQHHSDRPICKLQMAHAALHVDMERKRFAGADTLLTSMMDSYEKVSLSEYAVASKYAGQHDAVSCGIWNGTRMMWFCGKFSLARKWTDIVESKFYAGDLGDRLTFIFKALYIPTLEKDTATIRRYQRKLAELPDVALDRFKLFRAIMLPSFCFADMAEAGEDAEGRETARMAFKQAYADLSKVAKPHDALHARYMYLMLEAPENKREEELRECLRMLTQTLELAAKSAASSTPNLVEEFLWLIAARASRMSSTPIAVDGRTFSWQECVDRGIELAETFGTNAMLLMLSSSKVLWLEESAGSTAAADASADRAAELVRLRKTIQWFRDNNNPHDLERWFVYRDAVALLQDLDGTRKAEPSAIA